MTSTRAAKFSSLVVTLLAVTLIVSTYHVFDQTFDEAPHIGPGMEWLVSHTYTLDLLNAPFARAVVAIGPFLLGARPHHMSNPAVEGNAILASGNYDAILTSARLGILVFFLFACYLVWSRARRWLGEWGGAAALALFCTCEPVLGHSGVATTDIALMTMLFWTVDRLWILVSAPSWRNGLWAGLAGGLALASKHSAGPFLVATAMLVFVVLALLKVRGTTSPQWSAHALAPRAVLSFVGLSLLILWAFYFFQIGSVFPPGSQDREKTEAFLSRHHIPQGPILAVADHVPAYEYFKGIRDVRASNHTERPSYFMGHINEHGSHLFYTVLLFIKTPIPFLILALLGVGMAVVRMWKGDSGYHVLLLCGAAAPYLVASLAHINMGLRHVLGVYPFLAILGASAILFLWRRSRTTSYLVAALLAWQFVACLIAWPDYLAYFNVAAVRHADYFVVDSDLDWGQDGKRLAQQLNRLHANNVWIAFNGIEDLHRLPLPTWQVLPPGEHKTGWIAVSELFLKRDPQHYGWLEQYKPVAMAGKSIRIYHLQ
ncbi:MAG TPA: glycosyltransferase family 39 protein [Acidobacteriaceae bacterium]|nr:glycosyltransferase family 39 protein [Acidobacteriaceae bacterium]